MIGGSVTVSRKGNEAAGPHGQFRGTSPATEPSDEETVGAVPVRKQLEMRGGPGTPDLGMGGGQLVGDEVGVFLEEALDDVLAL